MEGTRAVTRGAEAVYAAKALEPTAAPCEVFVVNFSAGDAGRLAISHLPVGFETDDESVQVLPNMASNTKWCDEATARSWCEASGGR